MVIRKAQNNKSDIAYILHANRAIEGEDASLTEARLVTDVFSKTPKAHIFILEENEAPVGLIFYSYTYWASCGSILWISQMYVEPDCRGKYFYRLKEWIFEEARLNKAAVIVWGTEKKAQRTIKLWQKAGAKELNDNYAFWYKKVE